MADVRPFRPLRYNPDVVGDLAQVVAPPYDVISDAYRDRLYERSPYNAVRLILNRSADRYGEAAGILAGWREHRALVRDPQPALCYYVEDFELPGGPSRQRAGIMGAVRLEPFDTGRIRPHERTFARAKEDRLKLLRACRANLSPIFGLYAGRRAAIDAARRVAARQPADIDLRDDTGERHRVWWLAAPDVIDAITRALADAHLVIADGHHRYETALAYRDELCAAGQRDPDGPHQFILMYLTSMDDPGLVILPTHRVLSAALSRPAPDVIDQLGRCFRLQHFPRSEQAGFVAALRAARRRFGVVLPGQEGFVLAILDDPTRIAHWVGHLVPPVRDLDVALLDSVVLRGLLGIDCTAEAQAGRLTYTHDDASAVQAVAAGAGAAFLMNPPDIAEVVAVCEAGETMPEKSTYFFPKLLSGLVFRPLDA